MLALLRLSSNYGYTNTWWRVMFYDTDKTFIGRLERSNEYEYTDYKKGEDVRWDVDKIQYIWNGEQFCYSDNITTCDCKGFCNNK